ncbi:Hypothetical predicted protein [Paramuricea clavata]|uniref:Uncharacterized protein n=1 Tax=Paramuricea clavata TaxID=317549 RepID=A0A7D9HC99_PARCT|nr:Hypothetical predicted protein [Paramuricea clavata]
MEYIKEKKLGKSQKEEVLKLAETMNSMGLTDEARLQSVTIGEINCIHGEEISEHGIKMLAQKFGIKSERDSFNPAEFVGQGYNIIVDKSVPAQIMTFSDVDDTKFGFRIPTCAQIIKVNETREYQMDFTSDESYMESRLRNLGLNIDLAPTVLKMVPQFGVSTSWKNDSSGQSSKTTKSSLTEYRIVKINIGNFESEEISFTKDFLSAVRELPDRYTKEEKNKQELIHFFNRFGHFVITSAYVGGAVEVKTCGESLERSKDDEESIDGSAGAKRSGVVGVKASGKNHSSSKIAKNAVLNTTETRWQGGRSDLHTKSTLESEEKLLMWKASLSKEPTLLTTEMSLEPISSVVAIIDKTKGEVCDQALCNMFQSKDLYPVRNRQDELALEEKRKMQDDQQERLRQESNLRVGSTKEPDTEGWRETITGHTLMVGGTIVVILAGILIAVMNSGALIALCN